ncbi:hypothetical protein G6F61_014305 [Rhizopus arrhizus]|nr:hypothetical protein G6F61_014305 [Rhizopus arrhizus]
MAAQARRLPGQRLGQCQASEGAADIGDNETARKTAAGGVGGSRGRCCEPSSSWKTNAGRGKGDDAGDQHAWALAPAGTGSAAAVAAAAGLGAAARLAGPRSHCNGRYGHPQCRERSGRA